MSEGEVVTDVDSEEEDSSDEVAEAEAEAGVVAIAVASVAVVVVLPPTSCLLTRSNKRLPRDSSSCWRALTASVSVGKIPSRKRAERRWRALWMGLRLCSLCEFRRSSRCWCSVGEVAMEDARRESRTKLSRVIFLFYSVLESR